MRARRALFLTVLLASASLPAPAHGQKLVDVTVDILDRWFSARDKEKTETKSVESQLTDLDAKINKFEQCKRDFEAAGSATGSRLGGLAARAGIRAKCGASNSDDMRKERQKILDGPETIAASAGGFKLDEYRSWKNRLQGYLNGDESGFSKAGLDLLKSKRVALATSFGVSADVAQASSGRAMGGGMPAVWTTDFAWIWIHSMFAMQYLSGATMFERDYQPGEWTRWKVTSANSEDVQTIERAFIGRQADRSEWWRMKTVLTSGDKADTIVMESLFRPDSSNEYMQRLVRMRGKFPGNTEAQEMMVPEQYGMWNMTGAFGSKPTKESIDGATVGTESVTTPAGTFRAKHVRFGGGYGTLDWWLDESAVGGWVKFSALDNEKKPSYTMELIGKGTGAKSELGITVK
jgi:hypothetical protein